MILVNNVDEAATILENKINTYRNTGQTQR